MEIKHLEVLHMPNDELLCLGKTVGFGKNFGKFLKPINKEISQGFFKVLLVHRDDLESRGVKNTDKLTDEQMQDIASLMADGIMESGVYWDALDAAVKASEVDND